MHLHRLLLTKTIWSLGIRIAGVGLTFIAYILLARAMNQADFGDFIYTVNLIALLALVAQGGFQTSVLRYAHAYEHQPSLLAGFIRISFIAPLVIAAALACSGYGLKALHLLPEIITRVLPYVAIGVGVFASTYVAQQSLKAMHRIVLSQLFEQIGLPLCLMISAGFFLIQASGDMPLHAAAFTYNAVFFLTAMIAWGMYLARHYPRAITPQYETKSWLSTSATLGLAGIVSTLMLRMDVLIIGVMLTSDVVAQYGVAARIAALLGFIYAALGNSLTPMISKQYHANTLDDILPLVRKLTRIAVLLNLIALLGITLLNEFILGLFGEHYVEAGSVLIILACAQTLSLSAGPLGSILTLTNHQKDYLLLHGVFAAILAAALWWGVAHHGMLGAALAVAIVNACMHAALYVLVVKKTGVRVI